MKGLESDRRARNGQIAAYEQTDEWKEAKARSDANRTPPVERDVSAEVKRLRAVLADNADMSPAVAREHAAADAARALEEDECL